MNGKSGFLLVQAFVDLPRCMRQSVWICAGQSDRSYQTDLFAQESRTLRIIPGYIDPEVEGGCFSW